MIRTIRFLSFREEAVSDLNCRISPWSELDLPPLLFQTKRTLTDRHGCLCLRRRASGSSTPVPWSTTQSPTRWETCCRDREVETDLVSGVYLTIVNSRRQRFSLRVSCDPFKAWFKVLTRVFSYVVDTLKQVYVVILPSPRYLFPFFSVYFLTHHWPKVWLHREESSQESTVNPVRPRIERNVTSQTGTPRLTYLVVGV